MPQLPGPGSILKHCAVAWKKAVQTSPQPLQFWFVPIGVHIGPPQFAKPKGHPLQTPCAQLCAPTHTVPHWPQLFGSTERAASHPSAAMLSQSVQPMSHMPTVHLPPAQPAVAWGTTQTLPQPPQFIGSVWRFVHELTQRVWLAAQPPPVPPVELEDDEDDEDETTLELLATLVALPSAPPSGFAPPAPVEPPRPELQLPVRTHASTHVGAAPGVARLQTWPALQSASLAHGPAFEEEECPHEIAARTTTVGAMTQVSERRSMRQRYHAIRGRLI
jgi:hypothetical protein